MPLDPVPQWPGTGLDSLPDPTSATYEDDDGFEIDLLLQKHNAILEAIETKLGQNPAAADALGYTYTGDGVNKGLWVPTASIGGPSLLVNSNFDVFQRSTGTVTSTTTFSQTTSFAADRMFVLPAGASVTQARSTSVPNSRSQYSLLVTGAASVTTVDVGQRVRASIVARRGLQSLVFSAYVFNNTGSAFTPNLRIGTPSTTDNFGTVTNRLDQALQSCASGAWTRVYAVFDPTAYTNIANGLECVLRVPTGVLVATKTANIAQFDLRPGTHLMGYVPPDEDTELLLCTAYCEGFGGSSSLERIAVGQATAATTASVILKYRRKRAAPASVTVSANSDWGCTTANDGAIQAMSAFSLAGAGLDNATLLVTVASGLVAGNATSFMANATTAARLFVNAELT